MRGEISRRSRWRSWERGEVLMREIRQDNHEEAEVKL